VKPRVSLLEKSQLIAQKS